MSPRTRDKRFYQGNRRCQMLVTMQRKTRLDPVIEVRDLTRVYERSSAQPFTAVDCVSFTVEAGQIFGLLGTNGAGKTSVLEVVEGLTAPTSGTVRVLSMDPVAERASIRPHQSIMLQSGGLPQALTVGETMEMWHGTCSAPVGIEGVLDTVQLTHRRSTKVGALSGGEQRRLDLACALVANPQVMFLDEPTTGLDPESRRRVWNVIADLRDRGVTVVLTTHYLEEAERLCDRVAIMNRGRIEVQGPVAELTGSIDAEISFTLPHGAPPPPDLVDTAMTRTGNAVTVRTARPQQDSLALLSWADQHRVRLENFSTRSASLEQVFHRIADAEAPAPATTLKGPHA